MASWGLSGDWWLGVTSIVGGETKRWKYQENLAWEKKQKNCEQYIKCQQQQEKERPL